MTNNAAKPGPVAAILLVLACCSAAWADVIWIGSSTGRGFRQEVDIVAIEADQLVYLVNGNRGSTPLARIQQIEAAGDAAFNQAEVAFNSGDWTTAADNYLTSARRANAKEWIRRRAAERLITTAVRAGRFDQSVTGFVQLTLLSPEAAIGREPSLPEQVDPMHLERAVAELEGALEQGVSPAQARPMLALLLNVQNRRGDGPAAGRVVERLGRVMGEDAAGHDPVLYGQVLIGRANLAMSRGQFAEAARLVNEGREVFVEPRQQSDALMILARAAEGQAGNDRVRLLDAALAYMKVVAFFKRYDEAPNVPEALLKAAQIHERLSLSKAAADLYRDLVTRYPDTGPAAEAQKRLDSAEGS